MTNDGTCDPTTSATIGTWLEGLGVIETTRSPAGGPEEILDELARASLVSSVAAKMARSIGFNLRTGRTETKTKLNGTSAENAEAVAMASTLQELGAAQDVAIDDRGVLGFFLKLKTIELDPRLVEVFGSHGGRRLERGIRGIAMGADECFEVAGNLAGRLPSGGQFELDVVVNDRGSITVIECKAGTEVLTQIPRFARVCRTLHIDRAHAVLVAPRATIPHRAAIFHEITQVEPADLAEYLRSLRVPSAADAGRDDRPPTRGSAGVASGDDIAGLIEQAVTSLVAEMPGGRSANDLAISGRDRVGLGRKKFDAAIRVMLVEGRLIGATGDPVASFAEPVHEVRDQNARAALKSVPFERPQPAWRRSA